MAIPISAIWEILQHREFEEPHNRSLPDRAEYPAGTYRKENMGSTAIDLRKLYRILAALAAIGVWGVSVTFSMDGFAFLMENQKYSTIGLVLALTVTVVELVWSHDKNQSGLGLAAIGLACYAYGIITNVIGVNQARGTEGWQPFSIALGLFLEIAPEPLFVWAVYGPNSEGSFFDNLLGKGSKALSVTPQKQDQSHNRPQPQPQKQQQRPPFQMGKPSGGGGKSAGGPPSFSEMRERARQEVMGGSGSGRPQMEDED
jgi:hypothetical protein